MEFRPRLYEFSTSLAWTEGKKGQLSSPGKTPTEIACPPEFGGPGGFWSPEDLLVASVEVCIMTTFLHLLARRKVSLMAYRSSAVGVAGLEDREFRFLRVTVHAEIGLERPEDEGAVIACMEQAARDCMVSRSLRCAVDVSYSTQVRAAESHH